MNGFINLLKPPGMSSSNAVMNVKKLTGEKVGHAGTLDPEASGILPIMVGRATRLLDYFSEKEKEYIAEISFEGATDTQDAQGILVEKGKGKPEHNTFEKALSDFTGEIDQCPPAYSALKKDGVPMYKLARAGIEVKSESRKTKVYSIDILDETETGYMLRVRCSGGTYIRTLCHDIGQKLKYPSHMRMLLRSQVGIFTMDTAVTLEQLRAAKEENTLESLLIPMDVPLQHWQRVDVPERKKKQASNGMALSVSLFNQNILENEIVRVYLQNEFLGMSCRSGDELKFRVIVKDHAVKS